MLGIAAGGAIFYLSDQGGGIDRSTPGVVAQQFLEASLLDRDVARIELFTCADWPAPAALAAVDPPADERIHTSWGIQAPTILGATASLGVRISFVVPINGDVVEKQESWTLRLRNEDGWRACGLTKNGSLNP